MSKKKDLDSVIENTAQDAVEPEGEDWETKGHLDTLMSAHKIMNSPDKMAKVNKLAGRHKNALEHLTQMKPMPSGEKPMRSLQDLVNHKNKKFGPPSE